MAKKDVGNKILDLNLKIKFKNFILLTLSSSGCK